MGDDERQAMELMRPLKLGPYQLNHRNSQGSFGAYDTMSSTGYACYFSNAIVLPPKSDHRGAPQKLSASLQTRTDTPGIYTSGQVDSGKPITEAVHKKGALFFLQLWHVGRPSRKALQPGQADPISLTTKQLPFPNWAAYLRDATGRKRKHQFFPPRSLLATEIPEVVQWFTTGARNAIAAGFDGCEIHGAHGYLIDQFVKDGVNDRTDHYGGSIENRCRLLLEITQALAAEIGSQRTAVRISPSRFFTKGLTQTLKLFLATCCTSLTN